MFIVALLLSFFLTLVNQGNITNAIFNTFLLTFSIYFHYRLTHQKPSFYKYLTHGTPLVILIGAIPLFTRESNLLVLLSAIGISLLFSVYLSTKHKKVFLAVVAIYLLFAGFYAGGLITPPFSIHPNLLISNDNWTMAYLTQMKTESQYMPYVAREMIFNPLINLYVMLSKIAGLYLLKNLYGALLLVNIYPLIVGLKLDLKQWKISEIFPYFCILFVSLSVALSRSVEINNTFLLLSPPLIYFVLKGIGSINKNIYIFLFLLSVIVATSP
jgi:hypothetical protein